MLKSPYFFFLHMESFHQFSWADMPQQAAAQYRYYDGNFTKKRRLKGAQFSGSTACCQGLLNSAGRCAIHDQDGRAIQEPVHDQYRTSTGPRPVIQKPRPRSKGILFSRSPNLSTTLKMRCVALLLCMFEETNLTLNIASHSSSQ